MLPAGRCLRCGVDGAHRPDAGSECVLFIGTPLVITMLTGPHKTRTRTRSHLRGRARRTSECAECAFRAPRHPPAQHAGQHHQHPAAARRSDAPFTHGFQPFLSAVTLAHAAMRRHHRDLRLLVSCCVLCHLCQRKHSTVREHILQ
jgi:hypothetical protein